MRIADGLAEKVAVVAVGSSGVLGALLAVVLADARRTPADELTILLVVTAYAVVAVTLSVARPGHDVGRVMLVGSCLWGLGEGALAVAALALAHEAVGAAGWLGVAGTTSRGLGWLVLVLGVPLLFPDGRTVGRDRRPLVLLGASLATHTLGSVLAPSPLSDSLVGVDSPTGLPGQLKAVADVVALAGLLLSAVTLVVAVGGLVHRWRAGDQLVRQQLLGFAAAFTAPLLLIPFIPTTSVAPWMFGLVSVPVPVAVGTAMLQRRLYDTQLVVNRTLTFAALSAVVAGVYAGTVGGVGLLLRDSDADWLPWAAAGVVAVTVAPLRNAMQQAVNRLTYGRWSQPADVLASTGRRLADAADGPALLRLLVDELGSGLGLAHVEITDAHGRSLAAHGRPTADREEMALHAFGQIVGCLHWGPPRLRARDRQLLADLAGQVGGAVHSASLLEELSQARERLVLAREEERRRLRRDLHDGLGPALAGLTLQVDTVRNVAAAGRDPDPELLRLRHGVASTVLDVRRIVEGLRPPALDELSLDGALRQLAERMAHGTEVPVEISLPAALPDLPAAVEVAAYRVSEEALTNAVRHSRATRLQVLLHVDDRGDLRLEVSDNGTGTVSPRAGGIGLTTMHERAAELGGRLTIRSSPSTGTNVSLSLPRAPVAAL